jgi:hypothetical protein
VHWEIPNGVAVESVRLLFSPDGGGTWSSIARGLPDGVGYEWTVPNVPTEQARVAVLLESIDESGAIVEGVLGVSQAFSIETAVGVGAPAPAQLALAIRGTNPMAGGHLQVEFALRDGGPARLELLDIVGRVLVSTQVGAMGPGRHSVDLVGGRTVLPGIYFLRLSQAGSEVRTRVSMLR